MASGYNKKPLSFDSRPESWEGKKWRARDKQGPVTVYVKDGVKLDKPEVLATTSSDRLANKLKLTAPKSEGVMKEILASIGRTDYRHSVPAYGYILDFFFKRGNLAIEVDGPYHKKRVGWDRHRDVVLTSYGIKVIHVRVEQLKNRDLVVAILGKGGLTAVS